MTWSNDLCPLEVRVNFGALLTSLLKCQQFDAADALWDWAEEWLDVDRELLEEELGIPDA